METLSELPGLLRGNPLLPVVCGALVFPSMLTRWSCWTNCRLETWRHCKFHCVVICCGRDCSGPRTWWRHEMVTFSVLLALCAGIHRSPVNSPYKGQWRGALMFSLICAWTNGWINNGDTGDLRYHRAHYDVTVMKEPWKYVETRSRYWNINVI